MTDFRTSAARSECVLQPLPQQSRTPVLQSRRILIVEDELLIAVTLEAALEDAGARVAGTFSSVDAAMLAYDRLAPAGAEPDASPVDAAIVDLHLQGELSFPLVRRLLAGGVAVIVVSGYPESILPPDLSHVAFREKPFRAAQLVAQLAGLLAPVHDRPRHPGTHLDLGTLDGVFGGARGPRWHKPAPEASATPA